MTSASRSGCSSSQRRAGSSNSMTKSSITRLCASLRIRRMHRAAVRLTMTAGGVPVDPNDFPAPKDGFVITQFLVVSDQDRSRDFYQKVFDGKVVLERDPVIMRVANTWLILNAGGGPTDDKPTVTLETPKDPNRTSAFMNIRVADIKKAYKEWSANAAHFLTEPKDYGRDIRAYLQDPDGHLIEVGQTTMARG